MKEILFRGKRKDNGEWIEGIPFPDDNWGMTICRYNQMDVNIEESEVDPSSVGRSTALVDANGATIFEGDIIKTKYGRLCKVVWLSSDCAQCWDLVPIEDKPPYLDKYDLWRSENLVIIGNIYDNPELLKGDAEIE